MRYSNDHIFDDNDQNLIEFVSFCYNMYIKLLANRYKGDRRLFEDGKGRKNTI